MREGVGFSAELTVPASVIIPAGQTTATIEIPEGVDAEEVSRIAQAVNRLAQDAGIEPPLPPLPPPSPQGGRPPITRRQALAGRQAQPLSRCWRGSSLALPRFD